MQLVFYFVLHPSSENVQPCSSHFMNASRLVGSRLVLTLYTHTQEERLELAPAPTNEAAACMTGAQCHVGQNYAALLLTFFGPPDPTCLRKMSTGSRGTNPITSELLKQKHNRCIFRDNLPFFTAFPLFLLPASSVR